VADTIVISLATPAMRQETAKLSAGKTDMKSPAEGVVAMKVLPQEGKCTVIAQLGDSCKRISLDFQKANIVHIFRLLTEISGFSVVVDPDITGSITMTVTDAPWDQVLDIIMRTHSLTYELKDKILRVVSLAKLEKEQKMYASIATSRQEKIVAEEKAEVLLIKKFQIKYADVNIIKNRLLGLRDDAASGEAPKGPLTLATQTGGQAEGSASKESQTQNMNVSGTSQKTQQLSQGSFLRVISDRGNVTADSKAGVVTVTDVARVLIAAESLIKDMDKHEPQIMIETRIVEMNSGAGENLGIEWGAWKQGQNSPDASWRMGLQSVDGRRTGTLQSGALPAFQSSMSPGSLLVGLLGFNQTLGLDLKLQALNDSNMGRILTNPRLMTINGKPATISQGSQVPYLVQTQDGISTAFKDVTVSINITPTVLPDKSVNLNVNITSTGLTGFSNIGGSDAPITSMLSEKTEVMVKDGETLVLGGVYKKNETSQKTNVPILGDIPGLGWLFKNQGKRETNNEYMIFITPRIVQTDK
jgi:type IV pilus assembly protein PilQ